MRRGSWDARLLMPACGRIASPRTRLRWLSRQLFGAFPLQNPPEYFSLANSRNAGAAITAVSPDAGRFVTCVNAKHGASQSGLQVESAGGLYDYCTIRANIL